MRRLKYLVLSAMVGATVFAAPAQAAPPRDCNTGDFPDPCPVIYIVCTRTPAAKLCNN